MKQKGGTINDIIGGADIIIEVNTQGQIQSVRHAQGDAIAHIYAYWFAWQAFYPQTKVYKP
ncbi:MAG: DUF3179 domain-containing protein [Desulfobacteraceae bacterium]|nr:DUF3179 domain-containing protein [Desulfobacteraceae bacterium]